MNAPSAGRPPELDLLSYTRLDINSSSMGYLAIFRLKHQKIGGCVNVVTALGFASLALVISAPSSSAADLHPVLTRIAKCSAVSGQLQRLQCFDDLSKSLGLNGPQQEPTIVKGVGEWSVEREKNPLNDTTTVAVSVVADSGKGMFGQPVLLSIRCENNKTGLLIEWNAILNGSANITYRIGSSEALTKSWFLSTDSQASFYPDNTIVLVKQMMKSDHFVAQVTPFEADPITAVFDTAGLSNAIKPLRETCHW